MAVISSPGLGSGLDINGIVSSLMRVESQPLTALATKEAGQQAKLSAYGSLKGALASLQMAARTLMTGSTFTGKSAVSSESLAVTASALNTAAAGSYNIETITLAKKHSIASQTPYADNTATFNTRTLTIKVGTTSKDIVIDANNNSLAGVRQAINDANAGVTATIVNTGTTNRLVLTSNTTGSAGEITVTVADSGSGGTHPLSGLATDEDGTFMENVQPPDDATFKVNNVLLTRSSNTITDAIDGVTLKLEKEAGTATITVAQDTASANAAIAAFVRAYNDAASQLKSLTAYDVANKKASVLTGDSTARGIQSQLSSLLGATISGVAGGVSRLSDIGIEVQKDGKLSTNAGKLQKALENRDIDLAALFGSTTDSTRGIAVRFNEALENVIGATGLIASRTDGINTTIKDIRKRGEIMQVRLAQVEKRYRAQFSALDVLVASMNQTSNYLTQQLANLPGASNNNR
ncbi:MAG: flagellar filament capping protein FliD [Rhodocyclaceae bacterium]|nr:flagellar filament capping protein FliD [Rhodocyclaceae bacterium]